MQRNNVPKLQNVHKCVATTWEIGTRNVRPIFDCNRIILIVHSTNRLCLNIERLLFSVDNYSRSFESILWLRAYIVSTMFVKKNVIFEVKIIENYRAIYTDILFRRNKLLVIWESNLIFSLLRSFFICLTNIWVNVCERILKVVDTFRTEFFQIPNKIYYISLTES